MVICKNRIFRKITCFHKNIGIIILSIANLYTEKYELPFKKLRNRIYFYLFVRRLMSYLRHLYLFANSVVQHIMCCVFALFAFILFAICCQSGLSVFVLFAFILFAICCQSGLSVFALFAFILFAICCQSGLSVFDFL